jgi:hypothetical protein
MAAALGARVYHPGSHGKELGWAPILTASDAGAHHGFGTIISPELRILHWHGDTFDLPAGTSRLASTDRYTNQAFAAGDFALALQFHLEVTVAGLERGMLAMLSSSRRRAFACHVCVKKVINSVQSWKLPLNSSGVNGSSGYLAPHESHAIEIVQGLEDESDDSALTPGMPEEPVRIETR